MKRKMQLTIAVLVTLAAGCLAAFAQVPVATIDPGRHGNLWSAQQSIVLAYQKIGAAQKANHGRLGGHAARAKDLLAQANQELTLASEFADAR